jgi:acetoin utilization deacetylase AcuC-like enzyme
VQNDKLKATAHSDTFVTAASVTAARYAGGAVIRAIDLVMGGGARAALCVVRPPGHHSGRGGLIAECASCGFCIFNSVAAGALYALQGGAARVAIVDFDAHHGNGTEEIVRAAGEPKRLLFYSTHLYDGKFYPGSGAEDDLPFNILNSPLPPLWTRPKVGPAKTMRRAVVEKLLPSLRAFCPTLILISVCQREAKGIDRPPPGRIRRVRGRFGQRRCRVEGPPHRV